MPRKCIFCPIVTHSSVHKEVSRLVNRINAISTDNIYDKQTWQLSKKVDLNCAHVTDLTGIGFDKKKYFTDSKLFSAFHSSQGPPGIKKEAMFGPVLIIYLSGCSLT